MIEQLKKQLGRDRISMKSITAMFIFGAIVLVFVLFGFQGKQSAVGVGSAARVNNTLISVADFRNESQRMEEMYAQLFAGQGEANAQRQFVRSQALENLITTELISQGAAQQGMAVSDQEVKNFILQDMQVFKKDGRFQKDLYRQILEANRMTPADFEGKVRKDIQNQRVRRMFEASGVPLEIENTKLQTLKETKINIAFAKIDEASALSRMQISEIDVQKKLTEDAFLKRVEADFKLNKAAYSQVEQVRASHILIKTEQGKADSEKKALEQIKGLYERAKKEDFGQLAMKYSEDIGSKSNKGDLGYFEKGKMIPEFENVAFQLKPGMVSEPVQTPYGYHLIKLIDKKQASEADFAATKGKIARQILAQEKFDQEVKKIEQALKENKTSELEAGLKGLGVNWDETGYTSVDTEALPKLGSRLATQAAFALSDAEPIVKHLVMDGSAKYILKFKGTRKEPGTTSRDLVAQSNQQRSYELFGSWIEYMRKKATIEKNQGLVQE